MITLRKHRLQSAAICIAILAGAVITPTHAAASSADSCREKVNYELAREQRLYRAYLFGKRKAEDAPIGEVRYDSEGWSWLKDEEDTWINSHPDNQGLQWTDLQMDLQYEHARILPIIGIFETKRVLTSELLPYLLQSIRALECRTKALCEVARFSEIQQGDEPVDAGIIDTVGCIKFTGMQTWPECHFARPAKSGSGADIVHQADSRSYCDQVGNQMIRREVELLKLLVEYDAGFRTLLQFAGNFDIFLRELRWPLSGTVRQAAQLLGQLERIPCFLSSCDSAPEENQ